MTPNEMTPRPDETLAQWLRRIDNATAELLHHPRPPVDAHAAYRVGVTVGALAVLHEGFALLNDTRDARRLLMLLLAQQGGLRNRRGDVHTVGEFLTSLRDAERGGDDDAA